MLQFKKQMRIVETETTQKNVASPKSPTSRRNFLRDYTMKTKAIYMIFLLLMIPSGVFANWNIQSGMYHSNDGWMVELRDAQRFSGWDGSARAVIIRDANNDIVLRGWARAGMGSGGRTFVSVIDSNGKHLSGNELFFNNNGTITYRGRTFRFTRGW